MRKLKNLSKSHQIYLQWTPSHVDISGNEAADRLAKAGASEATVLTVSLTFSQLFTIANFKNKSDWLTPLSHNWYCSDLSGYCLILNCNRKDQTAISCFRSAHLSSLKYILGSKCFAPCIKCSFVQASTDHILGYLGLTKEDLDPNFVLDFLKVYNFMDLIQSCQTLGIRKKKKMRNIQNEIHIFLCYFLSSLYPSVYHVPFSFKIFKRS